MKRRTIAITSIVITITISIILILSNMQYKQNDSVSFQLTVLSTYPSLEPININLSLFNNGTDALTFRDFSIDYNIEIHIFDVDNNHVKNLFRTSTPTPNITLLSNENYTKTINLRENLDINYWYTNDEQDVAVSVFIFKPGEYRMWVNYIDRDGLESDPPLLKSNEVKFTII